MAHLKIPGARIAGYFIPGYKLIFIGDTGTMNLISGYNVITLRRQNSRVFYSGLQIILYQRILV